MKRFWAWGAFAPFSLAVSLVFFSGRAAEGVLIALLLCVIFFHLVLNRIETAVAGSAGRSPWQLPASRLLQLAAGAGIGGIFFQWMLPNLPDSTVEDQVGQFFIDLYAPWLFGSLASRIPVVAVVSMLAAASFIFAVTPVTPRSARIAKLSLLLLLLLSLFTIWVSSSSLSNTKEVAGFVAETVAKRLIGLPIDLLMSVVWVVGLLKAFSALQREQAKPTAFAFPPGVPSLKVKIACVVLGWASLFGAMLLQAVRA